MAKTSRETAENVQDMGDIGTVRSSDLSGYRAEFVTVDQDTDLTPLLVGLPNDECQCSHWGYVFKGRMWFRSKDGLDESVGAGEAFAFTPGHVSGADGGSEFLVFTPSEQAAELDTHMMKRVQELQGA